MAEFKPKIPEAAPPSEKRSELPLEKKAEFIPAITEVGSETPDAVTSVLTFPAVPQATTKDFILSQVEELLSDDLLGLYSELPRSTQAEFKAKGEETASKIQQMIKSARVVAKEVLDLIVSWLRIIPGVNKFFLEQEAKIKTDKILALAEEQKAKQL